MQYVRVQMLPKRVTKLPSSVHVAIVVVVLLCYDCMVVVTHSVWCCVCALASAAVVCPKANTLWSTALQLLRFAASPLVAFHMHVRV